MKTKVISKPNLIVAKNRQKEVTNFHYLDNTVSDFIKEYAKGKFFFIRTYGCQANVRDEETMKGILELAGFTLVEEEKDAGIIIINTCAVRENAEDKVYGEIGNLKGLKSKNRQNK